MRVDERILPKVAKFRKHVKKGNSYTGAKAISLPENPSGTAYINATLSNFLEKHRVKYVEVYTDPELEAIALKPTNNVSEGYALIRTGLRGTAISARLREVLPYGRYIYQDDESEDDILVFKREQITFKKRKGKK